MPQFEPGHHIGAETRFKPGQSGNPGGRPPDKLRRFINAELDKIEREATGKQEAATKLQVLAERIVEDAIAGCIPSRKMLVDRLSPMLNRHEMSRDDIPMVVIRDYTGAHHEHCQERLLPSTVEDPPEVTSEPVVRAPDTPEASGWEVRRPDDEERDTTAVF